MSFVSPDVSTWDWDFGDNTPHESGKKATHVYRSAGSYNLKLVVNGSEKCNSILAVVVAQDKSATGVTSGAIESSIEGPSSTVVGKAVKFHETSGKATGWAWTSSESNGKIDGTGQEVTYTFNSPGKRTIYVSINGNKGKASMDVDVTAPSPGGGTGPGAKAKVNEETFKQMLYQVINRKRDVKIFKECLCDKINMVITVVDKKGKPYAFDAYCNEINDRAHKTEIDDVKLTVDAKTGCITGVVIKERIGSYSPWRK